MKLKFDKTERGFGIIKGITDDDKHIEIQKSSIATSDKIWIGEGALDVKELVPGQGWQDISFENKTIIGNNRMHLSQDDVKAMIPVLKYFVKHGCLPNKGKAQRTEP